MISNGNTIGEKINKFQFDYIKKSNRVFKNICRSILKIVFILTGLLLVDLLFLLINKDNRSLIDIIVGEYAVYEDEIKNTTKNEITKEEKINILKKRAKILIIFGIIFILLSIVVISFFYYISFVDVSSKSDGDAQLFSFLFGLFITMIFATIGILLSIFGLTTIRDYKLLEAKKE
jgi:high-affinity K+ transport system ATPase subunit B